MEGDNNKLVPIKWKNQIVMTTNTLAECFEVHNETIKRNFNRHKEHFIEGKHYYYLEGEELKEFKNIVSICCHVCINAPRLYLWTERGVARHAKILTNDIAWDIYEKLEDTYFKVQEMKQQVLPSYMIEDPIKRAEQWIDEQKQLQQLQEQNEILTPKAEFYDEVVDSKDLLNMKAVADLLNIKGLGRNNLYKFLRERNILNKRNEPYRDFINKGYFEVKESKYLVDDEIKVTTTTYVTQKGVDYIRKLVKNN